MRRNLTRWKAGSVILAFVVTAISGGYWYWNTQHQEISNLQQQIDQLPDGRDKVALVKDRIALNNTINGSLVQAVGGVLLFVTAYVSWKNLEATQEKQVTERFTQAINQLGNESNLHIRLGGIYALERIAKDSQKDHWTIMEVLTSFVREKSPVRDSYFDEDTGEMFSEIEDGGRLAPDIQATLTVIGRRDLGRDPQSARLNINSTGLIVADLSHVNFTRAKLCGVNLQEADLREAELSWADFYNSKLYSAKLDGANLVGAGFLGADLFGASLFGANLGMADFRDARLVNVELSMTTLNGAKFHGANLSGAFLKKVKGLTPEQIKAAKNWEHAHYDDDFRQKLGLPPKPNP